VTSKRKSVHHSQKNTSCFISQPTSATMVKFYQHTSYSTCLGQLSPTILLHTIPFHPMYLLRCPGPICRPTTGVSDHSPYPQEESCLVGRNVRNPSLLFMSLTHQYYQCMTTILWLTCSSPTTQKKTLIRTWTHYH